MICIKIYISKVYSIHYTHWDKKRNVKKNSLGDNNRYKKCILLFLLELQLITALLLIRDSYISWSTKFVSLKVFGGFSIFDSVSFLIKVYISVQKNALFSLTVRRHNSFQNWNNRKTPHAFVIRSLIFKLQQKVLKSNYICVGWSSHKLTWRRIF